MFVYGDGWETWSVYIGEKFIGFLLGLSYKKKINISKILERYIYKDSMEFFVINIIISQNIFYKWVLHIFTIINLLPQI